MTIYNEFDPFAAAWLRELVADRLIAEGTVDARDIRDIVPTELVGHRQVHLFAGIGVWSLALRLAGVPDDLEVWTASCPCQPFSSAGKGDGFADERHLWPAAFHLIRHCRPRVVMGEQVASPDGLAWLDVVLADLEAEGYATRAVDLCAAGVGAPHIRQRLYWLAYAPDERHERSGPAWRRRDGSADDGAVRWLGDADLARPQGRRGVPERAHQLASRAGGVACGMDDTASARHQRQEQGTEGDPRDEARMRVPCEAGGARRTGPTNGLWRDPDWLLCRDGKWRPVESSHVVVADDRAVLHALAGGGGEGQEVAQGQVEVEKGGELNGMHALREETCPKDIPVREDGALVDGCETEVLRQEVHGGAPGGPHQGRVAEELPQAVSKDREVGVRGVREDAGQAARSPRRHEPDEQHFRKPPDAVLLMPSSLAFAQLRGQRETAEAMFALRAAMLEEGALLDPLESPEEAWECLAPRSRARIAVLAESLNLIVVRPHPLAHSRAFNNRVGLLRGAGNAINVAQAHAFIAANIDVIA